MWEIGDTFLKAGASRPLDEYYLLKVGEIYTLMASYTIEEN